MSTFDCIWFIEKRENHIIDKFSLNELFHQWLWLHEYLWLIDFCFQGLYSQDIMGFKLMPN